MDKRNEMTYYEYVSCNMYRSVHLLVNTCKPPITTSPSTTLITIDMFSNTRIKAKDQLRI
jgi:hypothetical protein